MRSFISITKNTDFRGTLISKCDGLNTCLKLSKEPLKVREPSFVALWVLLNLPARGAKRKLVGFVQPVASIPNTSFAQKGYSLVVTLGNIKTELNKRLKYPPRVIAFFSENSVFTSLRSLTFI